jgi:hypothetical protein
MCRAEIEVTPNADYDKPGVETGVIAVPPALLVSRDLPVSVPVRPYSSRRAIAPVDIALAASSQTGG